MKKALILVLLIGLVVIAGCSQKAMPAVQDTDTDGASAQESDDTAQTQVKVINVQAQRFEFSPNTIILKKGEPVKLVIDNTDTTHGIAIPDLGVSGIDSVEFTPDKTGTFSFRCPTMCGEGHRSMTGTIVVQE